MSLVQPDETVTIVPSLSKQIVQTQTQHTRHTSITSSSTLDNEQKIQTASQIAHDIQLVQQVFQQQGLDVSLASQVVANMHCSKHLVESQRQFETQRLMVHAQQKHLDRQISHRQHKEAMYTAQYDSSWKEKLQLKRDKCWNAVNRLVWQIRAAHFVANLLFTQPLLQWDANGGYYNLISTTEFLQLILKNLSPGLKRKKLLKAF